MPVVVVALCVVSFSSLYLRNVEGGFLRERIMLGLVWFVISVGLDSLMFIPEGPMRMTHRLYEGHRADVPNHSDRDNWLRLCRRKEKSTRVLLGLKMHLDRFPARFFLCLD